MSRRAEALLALLGVAALVFAAWAAPWLRFVLTVALAKGLAVLGILLLLRAGQVSFGHAMFLAAGAYTVAFAAPSVPETLLLLPAAAVLAGVAGLLIGLFVVRYRDIFFGMLNLALSMVFYSVLEKFYAITKGTDGIRVAAALRRRHRAGAGDPGVDHVRPRPRPGARLRRGGAGLPRLADGPGAGRHQDARDAAGIPRRAGAARAALRLCALGDDGRRGRRADRHDEPARHAAARLLDLLRRADLHRHPGRRRQRARPLPRRRRLRAGAGLRRRGGGRRLADDPGRRAARGDPLRARRAGRHAVAARQRSVGA